MAYGNKLHNVMHEEVQGRMPHSAPKRMRHKKEEKEDKIMKRYNFSLKFNIFHIIAMTLVAFGFEGALAAWAVVCIFLSALSVEVEDIEE